MPVVRRDELDNALHAIEEGEQTVHISGEPGVGKTIFLDGLADELSGAYDVQTLTVRENNDAAVLLQDLLIRVQKSVNALSALWSRLTGGSVGLFGVSVGASLEDRRRGIQKLGDLSQSYSSQSRLVFCIDDIHKLNESDPAHTRGFIKEVEDHVAGNIHLVTAGQMGFPEADLEIHLGMFSEEQTEEVLRDRFPDIDQETIEEVHSELDGHPYYIGLLTDSSDESGTLELPIEDYHKAVEEKYLRSLSSEEEEFLRQTAPLIELDESICNFVLDISKTEARRTLESLGEKVIVRELGRGEPRGEKVFKVHDLFRIFLYNRLEDPELSHRRAFHYYAQILLDEVKGSQAPPLEGFAFGTLARHHLDEIYDDDPGVNDIQAEIDGLEYPIEERLRFIVAFLPHLAGDDWEQTELLIREFDAYRDWVYDLEPEDEEQALGKKFSLFLFDLVRAQLRIMSDEHYEDSGVELLNSVIERIQGDDLDLIVREEGEDIAQFFRDFMEGMCRLAIIGEIDDEETRQEHLDETYAILEQYGIEREISEECVELSREFIDAIDPGDQVEAFIENRLEEAFDEIDDTGFTRSVLLKMQSTIIEEMNLWIKKFGAAAMAESDRLMEYINEIGGILEQAENPFFVTTWYSIWVNFYEMFEPESEMAKELRSSYEHHKLRRQEYEGELEETLVEIEDFDIREFQLPDLFRDKSTEE